MSKRIRFLPYRTIKQKIAALLVDEYGKQQKFVLRMPLSRQEMVDQPGVPGLPFPGKMIALKREGVIDFHKNRITISNLPALEKLLQ